MRTWKIIRNAIPLICLVALSAGAEAQKDTITSSVVVVKEFEPTISDAFKISSLPQIVDTVKVNPVFEYRINSQQVNTDFELENIKPATLVGEPLTRLYKGYMKAGFGSYTTPMAELSLSNLRSKSLTWGMNARHLSSYGKTKNADGERVFSGYSDNMARLFMKRYYKNQTVHGNLRFNRDAVTYYGYNTDLLDTILEKDDLQTQFFMDIGADMGLKSNYTDSNHLNYDFVLKYDFFMDQYDFLENLIRLKGTADYFYDKEQLGADIDVQFYNQNLLDTVNNVALKMDPWFCMFGDKWRVVAGLKMHTYIHGNEPSYHWYPRAHLQYDIIDNMIIPYAGVDGNLDVNNYRKISLENPFVVPGSSFSPTNYKLQIFGGVKGTFGTNSSYNFGGKFSQVDSMYLYVNDTSANLLQNQFSVVYDFAEVYNFSGEINYSRSEKLNLGIRGHYYVYNMGNQPRAWHLPDYDLTISAKYNLRNKIIAHADLFLIGKRYAKTYDAAGERELKEIIDFNLGVEYRYSKILSGFINFNNVAAMKYNQWNYYPNQRFNIMVGITYSFLGEKVQP